MEISRGIFTNGKTKNNSATDKMLPKRDRYAVSYVIGFR